MISITCISDSHRGHKKLSLPGGDILIHAGDFSSLGYHDEISSFLAWFDKQKYKHLVYIAGNHDISYQRNIPMKKKFLALYPGIHYLEDSEIVLEGLKIYGSPWQPEFCDWAFNLPRKSKYLQEKWDKIPDDTDILITHTAPYGILDPDSHYISVGCELLKSRVIDIKPLIHCFGHLHLGRSYRVIGPTTFVNASMCNDSNRIVNKPFVIEINEREVKIIDF